MNGKAEGYEYNEESLDVDDLQHVHDEAEECTSQQYDTLGDKNPILINYIREMERYQVLSIEEEQLLGEEIQEKQRIFFDLILNTACFIPEIENLNEIIKRSLIDVGKSQLAKEDLIE